MRFQDLSTKEKSRMVRWLVFFCFRAKILSNCPKKFYIISKVFFSLLFVRLLSPPFSLDGNFFKRIASFSKILKKNKKNVQICCRRIWVSRLKRPPPYFIYLFVHHSSEITTNYYKIESLWSSLPSRTNFIYLIFCLLFSLSICVFVAKVESLTKTTGIL